MYYLVLTAFNGKDIWMHNTAYQPETETCSPALAYYPIGTSFAEIVDGGGIDLAFDASVINVLSVSFDTGVWILSTTQAPSTMLWVR